MCPQAWTHGNNSPSNLSVWSWMALLVVLSCLLFSFPPSKTFWLRAVSKVLYWYHCLFSSLSTSLFWRCPFTNFQFSSCFYCPCSLELSTRHCIVLSSLNLRLFFPLFFHLSSIRARARHRARARALFHLRRSGCSQAVFKMLVLEQSSEIKGWNVLIVYLSVNRPNQCKGLMWVIYNNRLTDFLFTNKSTGRWNGSFQNKSSFESRMFLGNLEYSVHLSHISLIWKLHGIIKCWFLKFSQKLLHINNCIVCRDGIHSMLPVNDVFPLLNAKLRYITPMVPFNPCGSASLTLNADTTQM